MLLDHLIQSSGRHLPIPGLIRIDDRDRTVATDKKAFGLDDTNGVGPLMKPALLESALQMIDGFAAIFARAAVRSFADEDMILRRLALAETKLLGEGT